MLGKLIKYDLKAGQRYFVPTYSVMLVLAAVIGISSRFDRNAAGNTNYIFVISTMLFGLLIMAAVILTIYLLVDRFYHNLLGNEGYLMFALPVNTATHILAKIITSLLWMLLGCAMVLLSGLIIAALAMTMDNWYEIMKMIPYIFSRYQFNGDAFMQVVQVLLVGCITVVMGVTRIYASIAAGHLWSGHRILGAALAFIGLTILEVIVATTFDPAGFNTSGVLPLCLYQLVWIVLYGIFTWYVLDRHLNLD
jgi:hypothetical protein